MDGPTLAAFIEFGGPLVVIGVLSRWAFRMILKTGERG